MRLIALSILVFSIVVDTLIQVAPSEAITNLCSWIIAEGGKCPSWLNQENIGQIVRIISIVGIACGVVWFFWPSIVNSVIEKQKIPDLGSLALIECVPSIKNRITTGKTDAEVSVKLKNLNNYLVAFDAVVSGRFNHQDFINNDGSKTITIKGTVSAQHTTSLILKFPDVPGSGPNATSMAISGDFLYDINYYVAPNGKRKRRTMKNINFETPISLRGTPGQYSAHLNFLYTDQAEE